METQEFNEGDGVYVVSGGWGSALLMGTVTRVTATQAIVTLTGGGELRFNRVTGYEVGSSSSFGRARIEKANAHLARRYAEEQKSARLARLEYVTREARSDRASEEDVHRAYRRWAMYKVPEGGES